MPGCARAAGGRIVRSTGYDRTRAAPQCVRARRRGRASAMVRQRYAARAKSLLVSSGTSTGCPQCRHEVDWLRDVFAACAAIAPIPDAPRSARAVDSGREGAIRLRRPGGLALPRVGNRRGRGCACSSPPSSPGWPSWARCSRSIPATSRVTRHSARRARPASTGDAIAVMFDPAITEAELRRVVTSAGGRIVDGPTTTHAFVLEVPAAQSGEAVQKLRAERDGALRRAVGRAGGSMTLRAAVARTAGRGTERAQLRRSQPRGSSAAAEPQVAAREVLVMLRLPPPHFRPDGAYVGGYSSRSGSADRQRIAEELAARFKLRIKGSWPMPALGVDCFVMEAPESLPLEPLIERMSQDARVESVQAVNLFRVLSHDDPLYPLQPTARALASRRTAPRCDGQERSGGRRSIRVWSSTIRT